MTKKKLKHLKSLAKKSRGPVTAQSLLASVAVKNVVGDDKKTTNNIFSLMKKSQDSVESTKEEKHDGGGHKVHHHKEGSHTGCSSLFFSILPAFLLLRDLN